MGAEPFAYEIDYTDNIADAVEKLKKEVFSSGDYRYSELNPSSISEALANATEDGTASILDLAGISNRHRIGFLSPLSPSELNSFFGTEKPTPAQVDASDAFWDSIGRCEGRYVVTYQNDKPDKIIIAGYSAD